MQSLNFNQLWRYQDHLIEGLITTLQLTAISTVVGVAIGVLGAMVLRYGAAPFRAAVAGYVGLFRNTPSLIQLFVVFFVLPDLGLKLPAFVAAAVALSLYFGAYATEIVRAGLDSVPRSQVEAGQCLGLTRWQVYRHVIMPPALYNVLPSFSSQFALLLLGTSLASQISVEDLFHAGSFIESRTYRSFEVYAVICAIYLALVLVSKAVFALLGRLAFNWPTRR